MRYDFSKILLLFFVLSTSILVAEQHIYLLRHAEKQADAGADPSLTEAGKLRAVNLVALLKDTKISSIYSTNYKRTLETVAPLAQALGLDIKQYDPSRLKEFAEQLKTLKGNLVIVGHSNTTPIFANTLLGNKKYKKLDESVYSNLYIITITNGISSGVLLKID